MNAIKVMTIVLAMLFVFDASVKAQDPVHFADANLKSAVEEALGIINPTPTDMLALEQLYAMDRGIEQLTGIEYAQNLWNLRLQENRITDISPLSSLTNLTLLDLHLNQISDISPLSSLTSLTWLVLADNQISNIEPISGLWNLQTLNLHDNQISDISPLSGLTNLEKLWLYVNHISDVTPLSGLTKLSDLQLRGNQISDIGPLKELINLETLNLEWNYQISDISPLSDMKNLSWLVLNKCQINDIAPLAGLTSLTVLYLGGNQISDITPLRVLTNLSWLYLGSNQISDIAPLAGLTNLTVLYLGTNQISDIDVLSNLTHLEELELKRNPEIRDISPLSGLTSLTHLWLFSTKVNNISVLSGLTNLSHLWLNLTKVRDFTPLSALTELNTLDITGNHIDDIEWLSELVNLSRLHFSHNEITDISALSELENLEFLDLRINPLEDDTYGILSQVRENNPGMILQGIVHVDDNATGANDGSSWADACKYFQDALADANFIPGFSEIWVAQGVYTPDKDSTHPDGSGELEATFQLLKNVTIKGGFAGLDELSPYARYIEAHETILSGDLDANDVDVNDPCDLPSEPTRGENSYHVVTGSGTNETAVLDGVTVMGGNANGSEVNAYDRGGGFYSDSGSAVIRNCKFAGNLCLAYGGGLFIGGGGSSVIADCEIAGNHSQDDGGGMFIDDLGCTPLITNCIIKNNSAQDNGGGIRCDDYSTPTIRNCVIAANTSGDEGGGIACKWNGSSAKVENCTITGNLANIGGAIYCIEGTVTVRNCILWGDTANSGEEIALRHSDYGPSSIAVSYSDVEGSQAGAYVEPGCTLNWGTGNVDVDPCFADAASSDYHLKSEAGRWDPNSQSWVQDDVSSPCIDAGDPNTCIGFEPNPNGRVVNMGAYGGTSEASLSPSGISCISADHPDYDEWVKVGEPLCWCYLRQCHGDADCKSQGKQKYWISTNDLDILIAAWSKPFAEIEGQTLYGLDLVCADFDHKAQGKRKYRVSINDLDILIANWSKADKPDPNCP